MGVKVRPGAASEPLSAALCVHTSSLARVHACEDSGQGGSWPTHVTFLGFGHLCADPVSQHSPFLGLRATHPNIRGHDSAHDAGLMGRLR